MSETFLSERYINFVCVNIVMDNMSYVGKNVLVRPKNILIADDEDSMRYFLKEIISDELQRHHLSHHIRSCVDGEIALDYVAQLNERNLHYDLIFLDVNMPNKNGLEVYDSLGVKDRKNVAFVTAHPDQIYKRYSDFAESRILKKGGFDCDDIIDVLGKYVLKLDK